MLRAAVIPPVEVREELGALTARAVAPGVQPVPTDRMHVVLAQFGNLPPPDVDRLIATIRDSMDDLGSAPTLSVAGGAVEQERSHEVVAAQLVGDEDRFHQVARDLGVIASSRRLFVDRRRFHPAFTVATLDPGTPTERAQPLVDLLQSHRGAEWPLPGLCLMRGNWSDARALGPDYEPFELFEFAT